MQPSENVPTSAPTLRVPYVIARSAEAVPQPLVFTEDRLHGGLRLSYIDPRPSDWHAGLLRARIRTHQQGEPMWRLLNTRRQWRCMTHGLCQVCGMPAADPDGRIPWLGTDTTIHDDVTNAPATCRRCWPDALKLCPQLRRSRVFALTVAHAEATAVLCDMFRPGLVREAVPTGHNIEIPLSEPWRFPTVLATQAVVRLIDIRPELLP